MNTAEQKIAQLEADKATLQKSAKMLSLSYLAATNLLDIYAQLLQEYTQVLATKNIAIGFEEYDGQVAMAKAVYTFDVHQHVTDKYVFSEENKALLEDVALPELYEYIKSNPFRTHEFQRVDGGTEQIGRMMQ